MTFLPQELEPKADHSLNETIDFLDKEFRKAISKGWYRNQFKDKIFLILPSDVPYSNSILLFRTEIIDHYTVHGWAAVVITSSEEKGERAGLIRVELQKD